MSPPRLPQSIRSTNRLSAREPWPKILQGWNAETIDHAVSWTFSSGQCEHYRRRRRPGRSRRCRGWTIRLEHSDLGLHELVVKGLSLARGPRGLVRNREYPDEQERKRHREQRGVVIWEQWGREFEYRNPDSLAGYNQDDRGDQSSEPPGHGSARGCAAPENDSRQDREVAARCHRQCKARHEGHVLVLERVGKQHCH